MKQFHIHHATGENRFTETVVQPRKYAGFVEAENLDEAYRLSQNLSGDWNPVNPCRSTSVGDLIQDGDKFYLVCGLGFKDMDELIKSEPEQIVEWENLPPEIQEQFD